MKKKDKKTVAIEEGKEFTAKTIVGGRPRKKRRTRLNIPVGIEKILYRAAIDPDFKKELLQDRDRALDNRGIRLTQYESLIFETVTDSTLALMVNQIKPEKHGKRRFMKAVAAAVVTLATGTAGMGCEDEGPPKDVTEAEDIYEEVVADIGIEPDIPPDIPDVTTDDVRIDEIYEEHVADIGIEPDIPPDAGEEIPEDGLEETAEDASDDDQTD
jgi:hypothetical protein